TWTRRKRSASHPPTDRANRLRSTPVSACAVQLGRGGGQPLERSRQVGTISSAITVGANPALRTQRSCRRWKPECEPSRSNQLGEDCDALVDRFFCDLPSDL